MINYKKRWKKRKKAEIRRLVALFEKAIEDAKAFKADENASPFVNLCRAAPLNGVIAVIYCQIQAVITSQFKRRGKVIARYQDGEWKWLS